MSERTLQTVPSLIEVDDSIARLRNWLEANAYAGYEPHDALTSPLLQRTPLGKSRFIRLAALQGLRRLPVNIRPLLGVQPTVNPVSLGWALKAYARLDDDASRTWIEKCIRQLKALQSVGYSGACWGYQFNWQTRAGFKPAWSPLIVTTVFIGSGLLDVYERYNQQECLQLARSACNFILNDLNRTYHGDTFCFSYSPDDTEQVYNATMLGATLLARVGAITGEPELIETARAATEFVVRNQQLDGSWGYAFNDRRTFIDNFHTGYVLTCLKAYIRASGDTVYEEALRIGWEFYRKHFITDEGIPQYYHNALYPIDSHAASQAILTCLSFDDVVTAKQVAAWAIRHMQKKQGYFIYHIHKTFTNRIPYLRWSNVWMFYALLRLREAMAELVTLPEHASGSTS